MYLFDSAIDIKKSEEKLLRERGHIVLTKKANTGRQEKERFEL